MLVVGGAGQCAGEVAGVGAQRDPAGLPGLRGQGRQRAAQQGRRGGARVVGARAQVGGQHDLSLGPGGHVRPADPLALVVIGHAALLAAVGQRRRPRRRQQAHHPPGDCCQSRLHREPLRAGDPAGQARGGRRGQPRHRRELLPGRVRPVAVQPSQEVLPGQLRRSDPRQQLPGPEPAVPLLHRPDGRIQCRDHAQPVTQLSDRGHPRVRGQRPVRHADTHLLTLPLSAAYPCHQIGVLSAEMIVTSQ